MSTDTHNEKSWIDPSILCRMNNDLIAWVTNPGEQGKVILIACLYILICTALYGFTFGIWRSLEQAIYSSVKMPILFFATLMAGAMICTMLAQVLGTGLSFKTVCMTVLLGMAVTSVMLASLVPVMLFIVLQMPLANDPVSVVSMHAYRILLILNVLMIGFCGVVGNCRLYRLLKTLTASTSMALRLNLIWI